LRKSSKIRLVFPLLPYAFLDCEGTKTLTGHILGVFQGFYSDSKSVYSFAVFVYSSVAGLEQFEARNL